MTRRMLRQLRSEQCGLVGAGADFGVSAKLGVIGASARLALGLRYSEMSMRLGALMGLILLATACTTVGDPGWQVGGSAGCRQTYGSRSSTSATRPDLVFFCVESP